jgi:hypothetical protein
MSRATRVLPLVVVLAAYGCGGSGGGNGGGALPRLWERQRIQANAGLTGVAIANDGTVDLAFVGSVGSDRGVVWQQLGGAPELVGAPMAVGSQIPSRPAVSRDASGIVHVVWGTSSPDEIRYAERTVAGWTVETIATDRFRPDVVVAGDGTPHIAFVDEATGNGMAYHAVRGPTGWQITPVHAIDWFSASEVGIVLNGAGVPMIAGPDGDRMGVWLAEADGAGGWIVEDLAADRITTGPVALAAGAAGVAVAFKDGQYTAVAWRSTGAATWSIEDASHHDSSDAPMDVVVAPGGPMVVSDVDVEHPNGLALLERTGGGWTAQLIGPRDCVSSGLAIAVDGGGDPAIAVVCNYALYYMTVAGRYPADWSQQCAAAASEMCGRACTCGTTGEECCWGHGGSSTCTSSFGCPSNALAALCSDPTISPAALRQCRDEIPALTCAAGSPLDLTGACTALYQPFATP